MYELPPEIIALLSEEEKRAYQFIVDESRLLRLEVDHLDSKEVDVEPASNEDTGGCIIINLDDYRKIKD